MKLLNFLFMFIVLLSIAYGMQCQEIEDSNSGCDIVAFTRNTTDATVISDATCTLNMTNPSGTNSAVTMTNGAMGTGWHNYTFGGSVTGLYKIHVECVRGAYKTGKSTLITVGNALHTSIANVNNSVMDIRNTDVPTITGNQDTIQTKIAEVNDTVVPILVDTSAQDTASEWDGLMVNAIISIDSRLNSSHGTGNWSAISSPTLTFTTSDFEAIANYTWNRNMTEYLSFNQSSTPYQAGQFMSLLYNQCSMFG